MAIPIRPRLLSIRQIQRVEPQLAKALNLEPGRHVSAGLVTCDQDDSLYVALDEATKHAEVDVVYAKSFYAGSAHASGPLSGEVLGVLAGPNPDEVAEGLWVLRKVLESRISFFSLTGSGAGPAFFPHVISEVGRYLAPQAGVKPGTPMAYLIAPPVEAMVGLDAALKSAQVRLAKFFGPPTETNFAGGLLVGDLASVEASAAAFVGALEQVVNSPMGGSVRPAYQRS